MTCIYTHLYLSNRFFASAMYRASPFGLTMNVDVSRIIASLPWNHAMRWSTLPVHLAQVSYKLVRNLERGEVPA